MSNHLADRIQHQNTSARDLVSMFLGKKLGEGESREVYEHKLDKTLVIKVDDNDNRFQNILEWQFWYSVQGTKYEKWFAPCIAISPNGHFLIQKKVDVISRGQYPKNIPKFFTDLKYNNFGMLGKQFVCFDYGTAHMIAIRESLSSSTKRASWRNR